MLESIICRVRIDDIGRRPEAGTGTGNDRSLDLPGLAGFFGSWFGTTMMSPVGRYGSCKNKVPRAKRGIEDV